MIYAFGDSYAAYSSYVFQGRDPVLGVDPEMDSTLEIKTTKSYLDYLSDLTGQSIGHLGTSGRGPLDTVEQYYNFLNNATLNQEDILIFCWSGMGRDIDKWGDPYLDPEFDNTRYEGEDLQRYKQAVSLYWLYLESPMQHKQSFLSSLLAIDGLLQESSTKNIFHFICFEQEFEYIKKIKFNFKNGIMEKDWHLYDHAHSFDDYGTNGIDDMNYPNHHSPKGSIGLAEYINEKVIK